MLIIDDVKEMPEAAHLFFQSREEVQHEFCTLIEWEQKKNVGGPEGEKGDEHLFLENPVIREYLSSFGITYLGNYLVRGYFYPGEEKCSKEEREAGTTTEFITGFCMRYDQKKNEIEICEKSKGQLLFHQLLQKTQSDDMQNHRE